MATEACSDEHRLGPLPPFKWLDENYYLYTCKHDEPNSHESLLTHLKQTETNLVIRNLT